ncbi:hypothetical protein [Paenibacillus flagellatus]|uniref:Uncharacterized protein n=1 Tax=Paenibacillus flagellatus TaxID=2211139 RepID=A0A2V5KAP8_9BACL|nr:hypothetical protein [Paenibacillus flagellatus]PYI55184.1 hypothetical protein DLM86_11710 [Paenibacillus flagellatus]
MASRKQDRARIRRLDRQAPLPVSIRSGGSASAGRAAMEAGRFAADIMGKYGFTRDGRWGRLSLVFKLQRELVAQAMRGGKGGDVMTVQWLTRLQQLQQAMAATPPERIAVRETVRLTERVVTERQLAGPGTRSDNRTDAPPDAKAAAGKPDSADGGKRAADNGSEGGRGRRKRGAGKEREPEPKTRPNKQAIEESEAGASAGAGAPESGGSKPADGKPGRRRGKRETGGRQADAAKADDTGIGGTRSDETNRPVSAAVVRLKPVRYPVYGDGWAGSREDGTSQASFGSGNAPGQQRLLIHRNRYRTPFIRNRTFLNSIVDPHAQTFAHASKNHGIELLATQGKQTGASVRTIEAGAASTNEIGAGHSGEDGRRRQRAAGNAVREQAGASVRSREPIPLTYTATARTMLRFGASFAPARPDQEPFSGDGGPTGASGERERKERAARRMFWGSLRHAPRSGDEAGRRERGHRLGAEGVGPIRLRPEGVTQASRHLVHRPYVPQTLRLALGRYAEPAGTPHAAMQAARTERAGAEEATTAFVRRQSAAAPGEPLREDAPPERPQANASVRRMGASADRFAAADASGRKKPEDGGEAFPPAVTGMPLLRGRGRGAIVRRAAANVGGPDGELPPPRAQASLPERTTRQALALWSRHAEAAERLLSRAGAAPDERPGPTGAYTASGAAFRGRAAGLRHAPKSGGQTERLSYAGRADGQAEPVRRLPPASSDKGENNEEARPNRRGRAGEVRSRPGMPAARPTIRSARTEAAVGGVPETAVSNPERTGSGRESAAHGRREGSSALGAEGRQAAAKLSSEPSLERETSELLRSFALRRALDLSAAAPGLFGASDEGGADARDNGGATLRLTLRRGAAISAEAGAEPNEAARTGRRTKRAYSQEADAPADSAPDAAVVPPPLRRSAETAERLDARAYRVRTAAGNATGRLPAGPWEASARGIPPAVSRLAARLLEHANMRVTSSRLAGTGLQASTLVRGRSAPVGNGSDGNSLYGLGMNGDRRGASAGSAEAMRGPGPTNARSFLRRSWGRQHVSDGAAKSMTFGAEGAPLGTVGRFLAVEPPLVPDRAFPAGRPGFGEEPPATAALGHRLGRSGRGLSAGPAPTASAVREGNRAAGGDPGGEPEAARAPARAAGQASAAVVLRRRPAGRAEPAPPEAGVPARGPIGRVPLRAASPFAADGLRPHGALATAAPSPAPAAGRGADAMPPRRTAAVRFAHADGRAHADAGDGGAAGAFAAAAAPARARAGEADVASAGRPWASASASATVYRRFRDDWTRTELARLSAGSARGSGEGASRALGRAGIGAAGIAPRSVAAPAGPAGPSLARTLRETVRTMRSVIVRTPGAERPAGAAPRAAALAAAPATLRLRREPPGAVPGAAAAWRPAVPGGGEPLAALRPALPPTAALALALPAHGRPPLAAGTAGAAAGAAALEHKQPAASAAPSALADEPAELDFRRAAARTDAPAAAAVPETSAASIDMAELQEMVKKLPQFDIKKIADRVYREIERKLKFDRQTRGL